MKRTIITLCAVAIGWMCQAQIPVYQDETKPIEGRVKDALGRMTLEEKVAMCHAQSKFSSPGVPRLGIPELWMSDGPHGVREEIQWGSWSNAAWTNDSCTAFPALTCLAATWNPEMAALYGKAVGEEARFREKDILLGPGANIYRTPLNGRNFEYLGEDPYLTSTMIVPYVQELQKNGVAACVKHYALNNQETNRGSVNVIIDERTMREIYLKPFEDAVVKGGAMSVMPAYNKVNGYYGTENFVLNNEILRGDWGFKGMTVSDWGGTHSTMGAALGGLNVQMTGDNYFGQPLIDSIRAGKLSEEIVNDRVREILRLRFAIEPIPENVANTVQTSQPASRQTAYNVATKSIVLLKNEGGLLPINSEKVKKIAVIGRNAIATTAAGGMGAGVKTPYEITPLQGLQNRSNGRFEINYAAAYKNYLGMFGRMMMRMRGGNGGNANAANDIALDINEAADADLLKEATEAATNFYTS